MPEGLVSGKKMAVLFVLVGSLLLFRGAGTLGVETLGSWVVSARFGLAVMLLFTAAAHFNSMKEDLVRMLPPWVPWPRAAIAITGACEVLGAVGLLIPRTRHLAGLLLVLFFLAVFPANIHAARAGVSLRGRSATSLWVRAPMQLLFIVLAWWVSQP